MQILLHLSHKVVLGDALDLDFNHTDLEDRDLEPLARFDDGVWTPVPLLLGGEPRGIPALGVSSVQLEEPAEWQGGGQPLDFIGQAANLLPLHTQGVGLEVVLVDLDAAWQLAS